MPRRRKSAASSFIALQEIAWKAPIVIGLRLSALASGLMKPGTYDTVEPMRMVTEKLAAAAEGVFDATVAAGTGIGKAMVTGEAGDIAADVAHAALEPTRRQVRRNYRRLTSRAKR